MKFYKQCIVIENFLLYFPSRLFVNPCDVSICFRPTKSVGFRSQQEEEEEEVYSICWRIKDILTIYINSLQELVITVLFCLQIRGQSPWHALVSFPPWSHAEIRPSGCLHCATKRRGWSNIIINDYYSWCRRHFPISFFLKTFSPQYIHNFGLILIFNFHFY